MSITVVIVSSATTAPPWNRQAIGHAPSDATPDSVPGGMGPLSKTLASKVERPLVTSFAPMWSGWPETASYAS